MREKELLSRRRCPWKVTSTDSTTTPRVKIYDTGPARLIKRIVRGWHRRGALKRIFRASARPRTLRAKVYSQDPALRERFRRALANSAQYNQITQRNQTTAQTPIITPAEMPPTQALWPNVMINLPPVKKFRGRDGNACSIHDFISRIKKNAKYEFPDGDDGKEEAQNSMFRTYLGGDAKDYWGMLS